MNFALEVDSVDQSFRTGFWMRPVRVLNEVSLRVPLGSIFGFVGSNGAGKTTLIHLLAGLRHPTAGKVQVFGFEASSIEARLRIGYLPERPYFHEHLTGNQLLKYYGALSGLAPKKILDRIPIVLESVGMTHARDRELRHYSKGMLQRIGIAQALIHNPPVLILDEPMSGLDPLGRREVRELLLRLSSEGHTIFFSSHILSDVEEICDQIALIHQGKILGFGPIGKFLSVHSLETEIIFQGIDESQMSGVMEFKTCNKIPGGFKGLVMGQEGVGQALSQLIGKGAKIRSVMPVRVSLEHYFEKVNLQDQKPWVEGSVISNDQANRNEA